jgi:acetyl esterase/lipase
MPLTGPPPERLPGALRALSLVVLAALCLPAALAQEAPSAADLRAGILQVQEAGPDQASVAARTNLPFAMLQLRKLELAARSRLAPTGAQTHRILADGLAALERLKQGEALRGQPGELSELAYVAAPDGTAQPYFLYLPPGYDPARRWPLIVFLHGYVPDTSILDPWVLSLDICEVAAENGCALLIPYGRRNTDFQGVGEVDVLAATEEVKSLYPIDPDRVYLTGVSMGGAGTWTLALRHPGLFAAATPITGQTDMHAWWPRLLPQWPRSRADLTPFRRFLVEWDNPVDLVMNARNQPLFVQHGERDSLIPVEQSRTMVSLAAAQGIPIRLGEFKGASHYIYWDLPCYRNAWSWSTQQTLQRQPARVTYKTYSLEYDTAFWCRIADFLQWGTPATVDCAVTADGAGLEITATNTRLLDLDLNQAPLRRGAEVPVMVNGAPLRLTPDPTGHLTVPCGDAVRTPEAWPPVKRKGLTGPVEEVLDQPFLCVAGTSGDDAADRRNAAAAQRWAHEWDEFADGEPRLKTDAEVTAEDLSLYNLVLFGTPADNSLLARMQDALPITIGDHSYTVAGRTYEGRDLGLVMCYPNPLSPDRMVIVYAGEMYGAKCGINHKFDLIPDFLVFHAGQYSYDDTDVHAVGGYFDMNWELAPGLTWANQP